MLPWRQKKKRIFTPGWSACTMLAASSPGWFAVTLPWWTSAHLSPAKSRSIYERWPTSLYCDSLPFHWPSFWHSSFMYQSFGIYICIIIIKYFIYLFIFLKDSYILRCMERGTKPIYIPHAWWPMPLRFEQDSNLQPSACKSRALLLCYRCQQ